jgi:DNA repair protein RecO (recombination protein O)
MSRRVSLAPAYILHHRPYRDTSRILEVLTREHGRLSLFARGVRGPKAKLASALQPFRLLLLSWTGRGEAAQLTGAEIGELEPAVVADRLMPAFYLNELLLKLTTRHDPLPALFDEYHAMLGVLRQPSTAAGPEGGRASYEPRLRIFEKRLLDTLGYGVDLSSEAQTGLPIEVQGYYHFRPAQGLFVTVEGAAGAVAGRSLIRLASEVLEERRDLEDARRVLQAAIAHCLEGRELSTRVVAKSIARRETRAPRDVESGETGE